LHNANASIDKEVKTGLYVGDFLKQLETIIEHNINFHRNLRISAIFIEWHCERQHEIHNVFFICTSDE